MPLPPATGSRLARQVVGVLHQVADLLEALGENPHRIRAYRQGADTLLSHQHQLAERLAAGTLTGLPGIGKELSAKVAEVAQSGTLAALTELNGRVPPTVDTLMRVPGVDRKLAIYLAVRLHVQTVAQLQPLLDSHLLQTLPWLGAAGAARVQEGLLALRDGAPTASAAAHHKGPGRGAA